MHKKHIHTNKHQSRAFALRFTEVFHSLALTHRFRYLNTELNFLIQVYSLENGMHTVSAFTFKKVKRLCCFQLGCRMNSALNCEGHFLNLCCSVDPSPVGGSPFLATQVRGPVAWRGGWWEVQAATYSFLTLSLTLASYHTEALLNIPKQK